MTNVIASTFKTDDINGKIKVHKAVNGSPLSMKDLGEDEVLKVVDVLIYEDEIEQYGKVDTAEITILYTEEGQLYASVSASVSKSAKGMVEFFEELDSIDVRVVTRQSQQGRDFLNLDIVG